MKNRNRELVIFKQTILETDNKKQIACGIDTAKSDLDTVELLIRECRFLHGLFFCHLAIEKWIKAHVVKTTAEIPPKSHNLIYLIDLAELTVNEQDENLLGVLMKYQLEGRYPDHDPEISSKNKALDYLNRTKELLKWLVKKL